MTCAGAARVVAALVPVAVAAQGPLFRAGVDLVRVGVIVEDPRGRPVAGLTLEEFELREDGVPQPLLYLATGAGAEDDGAPPLHVGVLLDVSESMSAGFDMTRTAAIRLLGRLTEAADITVVDFDEQVRAARFGAGDFPRVVERIRRQKISGWTALYDAIGLYLNAAAEQQGRKVMLLYSDGEDTRSALRYGELIELLKASDVTVYAVSPAEMPVRSSDLRRRSLLDQIAGITGGQAFFPVSLEEVDAAYDRILEGIRAQYTLGYLSTNARRDGAWRTIDVRVTARDGTTLRIRSRDGYFAPFEPEP